MKQQLDTSNPSSGLKQALNRRLFLPERKPQAGEAGLASAKLHGLCQGPFVLRPEPSSQAVHVHFLVFLHWRLQNRRRDQLGARPV